MHAEKKSAKSRLLSFPTGSFTIRHCNWSGFANQTCFMFCYTYRLICLLGMIHAACNSVWYQMCNASPCCSTGWWGTKLKIMWNLLDEAEDTDIDLFYIFKTHSIWAIFYGVIFIQEKCIEHSRCMRQIRVLQKRQIRLCFNLGPQEIFTSSVKDTVMCTKEINNFQHQGCHVNASLDF